MAGFPGETFLQHIRGTYHWIAQEFEYLYGQLQGYLSGEHKDDGTHSEIHADKLSITSPDWFIRFFYPNQTAKLLEWNTDAATTSQRRVTVDLEGATQLRTQFPFNLPTAPPDPPRKRLTDVTFMDLSNETALAARGGKRAGVIFRESTAFPNTQWAIGPRATDITESITGSDAFGFFEYVPNNTTQTKYVFGITKDANGAGLGYVVGPHAGSSSTTPVHLGDRFSTGMLWESIQGKLLYGLNGVQERNRTVAMGEWTTPPYNAGDFRADIGVFWQVAAGDVITYAYTLIGKTMTVSVYLAPTSIQFFSALVNHIYVRIPNSMTAAKNMQNPLAFLLDNGVNIPGLLLAEAGTVWIKIQRLDGGNFAVSVDNTYVLGQITFEVL